MDRRPPAKAQTREPWTFRFTPAERDRITAQALALGRGEPTVFGRELTIAALTLFEQWDELEASVRTTASILAVLRPYYGGGRAAS